MMIKTHIALTVLFIILLISKIESGIIFVVVALAATFIPDVDTKFSSLGKKKIFRFLQIFMKHRGAFHSFTILFILTLIFTLFVPIIALPFFIGYGMHVFLDSFTVDGIAPFYPYKKRIYGIIKNGSKSENFVFISFILVDLAILLFRFGNFS